MRVLDLACDDDEQPPPAGAQLRTNYNSIEFLTDVSPSTIFENYVKGWEPLKPGRNHFGDAYVNTQSGKFTGVGQIVQFNMRGALAALQCPFKVISKRFDPNASTIAVVTAIGHPLDGRRYWRVFSPEPHHVVIETGAVDRIHPGPANYLGAWATPWAQRSMWAEYLYYIQRNLQVPQGHTPAYNIPLGVMDYDRTYIMNNICVGTSCN